jgi:hypothetical protein
MLLCSCLFRFNKRAMRNMLDPSMRRKACGKKAESVAFIAELLLRYCEVNNTTSIFEITFNELACFQMCPPVAFILPHTNGLSDIWHRK